MKLIFYELKKVLSKRTFMIIFIIMLLMNDFIVYRNATADECDYTVTYKDEYIDMINEYVSLPKDEARGKIQQEKTAIEITNFMKLLAETFDDESIDFYTQQIDDYRKNFPEEYKLAEQLSKDSEVLQYRPIFINLLYNQISYMDSYDSFISEMHSRADDQAISAVFSDENSFSHKNLYKTADDYKHLIGRELSICNKNPFLKTVKYSVINLFLIAVAALACIYLFGYEKTRGLFTLVRSTEKGRFSTIAAKLCSLFIIILVSTIIFMLSTLITNIICCGAFDFTVAVQSIDSFRNCILMITAGEFIVLSILEKVMGVMFIALFFSIILVWSSHQTLSYVIAILGISIEFWLYQKVDETILFNHPKFINIFYMLDSEQSLGMYRNINMFGTPVMSLLVVVVAVAVLSLLLCMGTCIGFCILNQSTQDSRIGAVIEKIKRKFLKINGTVSIFIGEMYKYLIQSKMALLLILLIVFAAYSSIGSVRYPYVNKWDGEYRIYMEYLQGDVSAEKEEYLNQESEYFNSLMEKQADIISDEDMSVQSKDAYNESVRNILETKKRAFEEVVEEYDHVTKMRKQGIDAKLIDRHIYSGFIYSPEREWRYMLMLYVLLVIMIPPVFSLEYKHDMVNILRPNRYGKGRLCANKFILLFILTIFCYATIYVPYAIRFIKTYGTEMFFAPTSSLIQFEKSGTLTIMGAFITLLVAYLLTALFIASLIAAVSVAVRDGMLAVIVSAVFIMIPIAVIGTFEKIRYGAMFESKPEQIMPICGVVMILGIAATVIYTSVQFTNLRLVRCKNDHS